MAGRPRELVHGDLCLADLEAGDGEAGRGQGAVPHTQVQHPGTGDMLPTQPPTSAQNRLVRLGSSRSWRLGRPLQTTHITVAIIVSQRMINPCQVVASVYLLRRSEVRNLTRWL